MSQFHSNLYYESDQGSITTATHLRILLQFTITKWMIAPFLANMWYHIDGCKNQYRCACAIYLISCIDLEFSIIIYIAVGAPVPV